MKKIYQFTISCLMLCALVACGGGNEKSSADGTKYQSYRDAVKNNDFESARDTLNVYREKYLYEQSQNGITHRHERKEAEGKYYQAFDDIYKAETQYLLSELSGEECKDKILFILEEIPVEGEKFPAGLCDYDVVCCGDWGDEGVPLDAYIVWTQHYNRLCGNFLTLAINRKNQELAKAILLQFVDNVEAIKGDNYGIDVDGVKVDGNHGYIKYTSVDRDAAQKKYDEAVASGAFK